MDFPWKRYEMNSEERAEALDWADTIQEQLAGYEETRSILRIPREPLMAYLYVGFHMASNPDAWIADKLPHDDGVLKVDLLLEAIEEIGNSLGDRLIDELKGVARFISEKGHKGLLEEYSRQATAHAELEYYGKPFPSDPLLFDAEFLLSVNFPIILNTPYEHNPEYRVRALYEDLVARYVLKNKRAFEAFRRTGYRDLFR